MVYLEARRRILSLDVQLVTTSSKNFFEDNGMQLVQSVEKKMGRGVLIYSEDQIEAKFQYSRFRHLENAPQVLSFVTEFRGKYQDKMQFMHYTQRMDKWIFKIAAISQYLKDFNQGNLLFLDADCVIKSKRACESISKFIEPALQYDLGIFRRYRTFMHPESGFLFIRNSRVTREVFNDLLEQVLQWKFLDLPSWTDDSLIDRAILENRLHALDFCEFYGLTSGNPVYESSLRSVLLHLKGNRKGKYSHLKDFFGRYK